MKPEEIRAAAAALLQADRGRSQIGLLTEAFPDMDLNDAYAIQAELVRLKMAEGRRQIGWKIGLTSRAMQAALGITTPDSGVLFDDMLFDNGATIPRDRFIAPRIEAELAFVLKAPLSGRVSPEQVIAATEYVVPALEILDTRIERISASGQARKVQDTIADNAANAGLVLGTTRLDPAGNLRWQGAIVKRNGVVEETGLGAGVLDDPAMGIVWLAERLAAQGAGMRAGDVVLSGSFIRPIECPPESRIEADFGPAGQITCNF